MADTAYGTNDERTQTKWSTMMFKYAMARSWFVTHGFVGKDAGSIIQTDTSLKKGIGDTVIFEQADPLQGTGQGDDGTVRNNTEAMTDRNMNVVIHERAHGVSSAGAMSEQRTATKIRESAKHRLGVWTSEQLENDYVATMAGLYNVSTAIETVNESYPSTNRIKYYGQTVGDVVNANGDFGTDALLSADTSIENLFGTEMIMIMKRIMQAATPRIMPVNVDGQDLFVCLMHPLQAKSLKAGTSWKNSKYYSEVRGRTNPLFTGSLGIWDGVLLHEYDRTPIKTGAGGTLPAEGFLLNVGRTATTDAVASGRTVARSMFFGAQAGLHAWAQLPGWHEDFEDIGERKPSTATDMLYGMKKVIFNSHGTTTATEDNAVVCLDTEVTLD